MRVDTDGDFFLARRAKGVPQDRLCCLGRSLVAADLESRAAVSLRDLIVRRVFELAGNVVAENWLLLTQNLRPRAVVSDECDYGQVEAFECVELGDAVSCRSISPNEPHVCVRTTELGTERCNVQKKRNAKKRKRKKVSVEESSKSSHASDASQIEKQKRK